MQYEFKVTTEDLSEIKILTKASDYYCALGEILAMLRNINKHEHDKELRDVSAIKEHVFSILHSRNIDLDE